MYKIKVKPEGRPNIFFVEKEEIKKFIKNKKFKTIHNILPSGNMMLGADHDVESVLEEIDKSERIGILINEASRNNMRHSLAVIVNNELQMYDIGEITEKHLII